MNEVILRNFYNLFATKIAPEIKNIADELRRIRILLEEKDVK